MKKAYTNPSMELLVLDAGHMMLNDSGEYNDSLAKNVLDFDAWN